MLGKCLVLTLLLLMSITDLFAVTCDITKGRVANKIEARIFDFGLKVNGRNRKLIQFSTPLQVTTDGAQDSYGPDDIEARRGINQLCNAIEVYKTNNQGMRIIKLDNCKDKLSSFHEFRVNNWENPSNIEVVWRGGIVAKTDDSHEIPCIFTSGKLNGFFGTKTNLKNGLESDKGECDINDQIDPRKIPGITIEGGHNFIRDAGVELGDLAIASYEISPDKYRHIPAIIIDTGGVKYPAMGTIALNSALLNIQGEYKTHNEILSLDMKHLKPVTITIIPGSFGFNLQRPFSYQNISDRVNAFVSQSGYSTLENLLNPASCNFRKN
jgi:hypothetical protein